ncbi:substrate-binding and VWA domain-containing protein [Terrabacter sp. 2RAF25]|uniref:substrate-binding and VWA domain-containing protein n=1 Tax=Terrabacter sp. 2RAF25 TaxID=3232998 RepID=UPI003F98AF61
MTGAGGPGSGESGGPGRRVGPYEQSLRESRERVEAAARQRARRRRRTRLGGAAAIVVVAAALGFGAYRYLGATDVPTALPTTAAQPTSCTDPVKVRVSAAPAIAPAVAAAAEDLAKQTDGPCAAYTIDSEEPYAVSGSLIGTARPDAWVTDSGSWTSRAGNVSGTPVEAGAPFASSAVVIAMKDSRASTLGTRLGWADLLGGPVAVRIPDPRRSAVGEAALSVATPLVLEARLRTVAAAGDASLDQVAASDGRAGAVVTQAQLLAWNAEHPDQSLAAVAPAEGAPAVDYSVVSLTTDAAKKPLVAALEKHLTSDSSRKLLQDSGFRTSGGDPADPSPLYGTISVAGKAGGAPLAKATGLWATASKRTQALLAVDVSGSMLERDKEGKRLDVLQRATVRAVGGANPGTLASLWIYSQHIGSRGDDFRQLIDFTPLGDAKRVAGFDKAVAGLDSFVGGGSGLYDTIASTYDRAQSAWRAGYTNTVVIVADGPNEDDYGLTLDLLKQRLAATKDAARPVQVVVLGLGARVDAAAMRQVVAITGGQYVAGPSLDRLQPALVAALGG